MVQKIIFLLLLSHLTFICQGQDAFRASQIEIFLDDKSLIHTTANSSQGTILLPISDRGMLEFEYQESSILAPDFAAKMPDIKTFKIKSKVDPTIRGRLLISPQGIFTTLLTKQGLMSIYPGQHGYVLEKGVTHRDAGQPLCTHFEEEGMNPAWIREFKKIRQNRVLFNNGTQHKRYNLAVVCTGEYYQSNGNNDNAVKTSIIATVNSINVIYENELAVKLILLEPKLYNNPATDPFVPDTQAGADSRPTQAGKAVDMNWGTSSYHIGHVFHHHTDGDGWSNGGVAQLAVVCSDFVVEGGPQKARGWSGSYDNTGNGWIALAAHEIGHMFGATHTFNGSGGSCDDAIDESSAYEIGSGTTIMSYQGICGDAQNIQGGGVSDNYFHVHSLYQMVSYINSFATCANVVPLQNTPPTVDANPCGGEFRIPKTTPFYLSGTGSDLENSNITYTWEQYDEDGQGSPTQGLIGTGAGNHPKAPLFRSFSPSLSPDRYFPTLSTIRNGLNSDPFQALPRKSRTLHFQLTARDNNNDGGGVATSEMEVLVSNTGPLNVLFVADMTAGNDVTIQWNTNGSDDLCDTARIRLSVDGGVSYSYDLAAVPYSAGSATVTIPPAFPDTDQGRIMVACGDDQCHTFFAVSNNFSINSDCKAFSNGVCDTKYEVFEQGDAALNLSLSSWKGSPQSSITQTIESDFSTLGPVVLNDIGGTGCVDLFETFRAINTFVVDKKGSYTFNPDIMTNGYIVSIFKKGNYTDGAPCDAFIRSNATSFGGTSFTYAPIEVELDACTEYLLISAFTGNANNLPKQAKSGLMGPGNVFVLDETPNNDYQTTFVAVNDQGVIEIVSDNSDFRNLSGGLYDIYSVSYKVNGAEPPANVDPTSWEGMNFSDVKNQDCILASANKKQILVSYSCRILDITAGDQSPCDPLSNTFTQEVIITYEQPPSGGVLIVNGIQYPITGSPQSIMMTGQISDGMPKSVGAKFSQIPGCAKIVDNVFTAPENCCPIEFDLGPDRVICEGDEIILDGGIDGASYKWFRDGILLDDTLSTLVPAQSGTYTLEVTNDQGCSKTDIVSIIINPLPFVELFSNDTTFCDGDGLLINGEISANHIQWYRNGDLLPDDTLSAILITSSGQYVVIGMTDAGCSASDTIAVENFTTPSAYLGGDQDICEGQVYEIGNLGTGGDTYRWSRNGTPIPGQENDTLEVTQTGTYVLEVSNQGHCPDYDTVMITFHPLPIVVAGDDKNFCVGQSTTLNGYVEADMYAWYFQGNVFSTELSPVVNQSGEYILIGQNSIGCGASDTVVVNEVMPPEIDLGEDRLACLGSTVDLSIDSIGLVMWTLDGAFFSNNAAISTDQPGTYVVQTIAASGCGSSDTIVIDFSPGPDLDIGGDVNLCQGESYTITATTPADNITWVKDGNILTGQTSKELTVTEAGEYMAIVVGDSGCEVQKMIVVTVFDVPTLNLGEDLSICGGDFATLQSGVQNVSYEWTLDGATISTDSLLEVSSPGLYVLTITNDNGCTASDDIRVQVFDSPQVDIEDMYTLCEGQDLMITAQSNGTSFEWTLDGNALPDTGADITVNQTGLLRVMALNDAGCASMDSSVISAAPTPVVNLGEDIVLCPRETTVLDGGSHTSYMWSTGSTAPTLTIIPDVVNDTSEQIISLVVTNEEGCSATDEINITFLPVIEGHITPSASGVCDGEPVQLIASGGLYYQWVDPNNTLTNISGNMATASPSSSTTYEVIITDDCPDNEDRVSIKIDVFEASQDIDAGEDDCVIIGQSITLNASGGTAYQWHSDPSISGDLNTATPEVMPTVETTYYVDITDDNGCVFTDSVTICILDDPLEDFKLINLITPNGDGDNDVLIFPGLEAFPDNRLRIFNRWGYPVFEQRGYQTNLSELWNGENGGDVLPADTYFYILEFNGKTYKSDITILR